VNQNVADLYLRFAEFEARGVSDTYFEWALSIAADEEVIARISALPGIKRQANLVFAAARHLGAPVGPYMPFREWLLEHWESVVPVIMARSTQTNEAGRSAVLLPVLSRLDGPLALIEAGASAGLVLYPDRYSYRYDVEGEVVHLDPADGPSRVNLACAIDRESVPSRLPDIAWRAGADLNPLDVRDPHELAWLETLVWPEHDARRERLHNAAALAALDPPNLVRGDILETIPNLVQSAPAGTHVVVMHSAVLVYLAPARRQEFAELMMSMDNVTWVSNEGPGVMPRIGGQVEIPIAGRTVIAISGRAVALAGPHGQSYMALS
jgi:hypothetical protein